VSVITESFTRAAHARASALGMPTVQILALPSPLAPRAIPEVQELAHEYAGQIASMLTGGR
jgi:hypothetical protein